MTRKTFKSKFTRLFFICIAFYGFMITSVSAETLRLLEWGHYIPDKIQKQIIKVAKEKYKVDLSLDIKYVKGNDGFFPALKSKSVDIITPSHNVPRDMRYRLIKHRLVLPLDLDNIPNYKNVDSGLQKAGYCTEGEKVYGIPIARGPYGLVYNTDFFKQAPTSWNIFLDPKYKGKYSIGKYQYEENIFCVALAMGYSKEDISNYKKLNNPEFQKKLAEFANNAHGMWEGEDKAEDLKGLAFATAWGSSLKDLKKAGEIWKMAEPKEGTTAWVDNLMISHTLKQKPILKKIAEELANIILSDDYQIENIVGIGITPVVSTIKDKLNPDQVKRFHLDDPNHFKNSRILWPTLNKFDRKGLKRLWDKALNQKN